MLSLIVAYDKNKSIGQENNRINRVLTRNKDSLNHYSNIEIYSDDSILENIETEKAYIFGGGTIYSKFFDKCDEMFITEVDTIVDADTKFPDFDENEWDLLSREEFKKDDKNEFNYSFLHYIRKRKE